MATPHYLERIRAIAERVADSEGLEVVDVELQKGRRSLLRVFIDKPEGVTHRDCEVVSTQLSAILDVEDLVPGSYTLEVSSPGVERRLHKPSDYERFTGKKVRLILKQPIDGRRQLTGTVDSFAGGTITLTTDQGQHERIAFEDVERANLVFEWK
jgi:ribosome maturation factor RimP